MKKEGKTGRGGRREGAGRPGSNSKLYTFRAPGTLTPFIDRQENKTEFFKQCIKEKLKREERNFEMAPNGIETLGTVYPATEVKGLELPIFDVQLVAGFPIPLDNDERAESINLLNMLCPNAESSYLIRVSGNSMIDAGIFSGDIVIVDKSNRNPSEHEVAVCEFNGEYTLKHFVKEGNVGWLVPANPDFPRIRVTEDDQFNVWGTVTYVLHRPRD